MPLRELQRTQSEWMSKDSLGADTEAAQSTTDLMRAATLGDERAWELLVHRYSGRIWGVVRAYRLQDSDAADVVNTTWLRLLQNMERIREPEAVGAWLAVTARRECLRALRKGARERPVDDMDLLDPAWRPVSHFQDRAATAERDRVLLQCVSELPERCQELARALLVDPPLSYQEISAVLGMPIGSIGPTRARCLQRLRQLMERAGVTAELCDA